MMQRRGDRASLYMFSLLSIAPAQCPYAVVESHLRQLVTASTFCEDNIDAMCADCLTGPFACSS